MFSVKSFRSLQLLPTIATPLGLTSCARPDWVYNVTYDLTVLLMQLQLSLQDSHCMPREKGCLYSGLSKPLLDVVCVAALCLHAVSYLPLPDPDKLPKISPAACNATHVRCGTAFGPRSCMESLTSLAGLDFSWLGFALQVCFWVCRVERAKATAGHLLPDKPTSAYNTELIAAVPEQSCCRLVQQQL